MKHTQLDNQKQAETIVETNVLVTMINVNGIYGKYMVRYFTELSWWFWW